MKSEIIIGSRESRLAVIQSEMVKAYIEENNPCLTVSLLTMKTTGDIILDRTLDKVGGKGLFVKELDKALMEGRSDISVHSLKDMPMEVPNGLPVVAYSKREDPRDVLVLPRGAASLEESLSGGLPIGCSSFRRVIQLKQMYPGAQFKPVRGNVLTRLAKLDQGEYSALILAAAGLKRLGLEDRISRFFEPEEMIPSAGQGILAIQGKKGEDYSYLKGFEDEEAACAAVCERAFVKELNGGCSSPVAAHARIIDGELVLLGLYYDEETDGWIKGRISMELPDKSRLLEQAAKLGSSYARELCREYRKGVQR